MILPIIFLISRVLFFAPVGLIGDQYHQIGLNYKTILKSIFFIEEFVSNLIFHDMLVSLPSFVLTQYLDISIVWIGIIS